MSYTDGNWTVEPHHDSKTTPSRVTSWVLYSDLDDEGHSPEDCLGEIYGGLDEAEMEANAHLVGAAARLYEALGKIWGFIEDGTLVRNTDGDGDAGWAMKSLPLVMTLKAAEAALAHARGEKK